MSHDDIPAEAPRLGKYLTTEDLAGLLRISPATVRFWRHIGEGPRSFKAGRKSLYDEADVLAWIEAQRSEQAAP